jgi:hypothetical protein
MARVTTGMYVDPAYARWVLTLEKTSLKEFNQSVGRGGNEDCRSYHQAEHKGNRTRCKPMETRYTALANAVVLSTIDSNKVENHKAMPSMRASTW